MADEMKSFELLVVLRVRQRGADASDAIDRAQSSLLSTLSDKELFPDARRRQGYWDATLGARLLSDRLGQTIQVLMTKERES
jgi:hypothetical protein